MIYFKVLENEKVDETVKNMAQRKGKETNYWNSFIYIKAKLQKTRLAELSVWHELKSQEKEAIV